MQIASQQDSINEKGFNKREGVAGGGNSSGITTCITAATVEARGQGGPLAALLQVVCCFVSPFVRRSVDGKTPLRATPQKRLNGMEGGGEIHLQIASSSLCRVLPISAAAMPLCLLPPNVTVVNGDTSSHTGANKRKRGPSLIPVRRPSYLPY